MKGKCAFAGHRSGVSSWIYDQLRIHQDRGELYIPDIDKQTSRVSVIHFNLFENLINSFYLYMFAPDAKLIDLFRTTLLPLRSSYAKRVALIGTGIIWQAEIYRTLPGGFVVDMRLHIFQRQHQ